MLSALAWWLAVTAIPMVPADPLIDLGQIIHRKGLLIGLLTSTSLPSSSSVVTVRVPSV